MIRPDGVLAITLRPVEYWSFARDIPDSEKPELESAHRRTGFAFRPHATGAAEPTYGDTSMTVEFLVTEHPGWRVASVDRSLQDPYQIVVFLTPDRNVTDVHVRRNGPAEDATEPKPPPPSVATLARTEAKVWEASSYYDDAERWTWLFWSEAHPFRPLFEQLDLSRVLELACGHGRHSEYLLAHYGSRLGSLVMMDILQSNVDYCNARLGQRENLRVLVNNGVDFQPMPASSLTSIFCYDAMVHFDRQVVRSYLGDAVRVLVPGGKALFHHSNYSFDPDSHFGTNPLARAFMSKGLFARYAERLGLEVLQQTVFDWGGESGLDCLTLLAKPKT